MQGSTASREELPNAVDLIVVLGGDGTLLAMADRIAQAGLDIPILGVNFGSLGFLTEIRIDELFPSLQAIVDGKATFDERLMLAATARYAAASRMNHASCSTTSSSRRARCRG